jgi:hypothetical protein
MWMLSASRRWRWLSRGAEKAGRSDCPIVEEEAIRFPDLEKAEIWERKMKTHKSGVQSVGVFARNSIEIRSYLQHAHTHGQAIQQQKLLERRQAVLAVEKCI